MKSFFRLFLILCFFSVPDSAFAKTTHSLVTDTGYYFVTSHEGKIDTQINFLDVDVLSSIPYKIGKWQGEDVKHNDDNLVFFRKYVHVEDNVSLYFIAVHGFAESKFHTAEVCYINDGWSVLKRNYFSIKSGENTFESRYFVAAKKHWRHFLSYWFMWNNSARLMNEGCVMFRLSVSMGDAISEDKAKFYTVDFLSNLTRVNVETKTIEVSQKDKKGDMELKINKNSPYANVRKKSLVWLKNQVVPNEVVKDPAYDRRNLILSYELSKTAHAYKYIFSKSSLYDNAVAVIALCIEQHFELAGKIVEGIIRMGGEDGELFFTFNTHNSWPNKQDNWGAIIRSGASAWAGQAIVFYIRAQFLLNDKILEENLTVKGYLKYAELIADNMLRRMVLDKDDERYGLITGGKGSYKLNHDAEKNIIEESFVPDEVAWCSMEHNIDMYFFLKDLGEISKDSKYKKYAELMKTSLIEKCWNEDEKQFNRGHNLLGSDTVMALDCASWGALFLKSNEENTLMNNCLEAVKNYKSALGYRPYTEKEIYETYDVGKFYFPKEPKLRWKDIDFMWTEGALGVALAYSRADKKDESKDVVKQVLKYQTNSGGIRYASKYIPHEFSSEPSVASTGWLVIVLGDLEDNEIAKLFWS